MLRKLIKHEWIATRRILLPLNFAIILITLVGCLFLGTNILHSQNSLPLVILLILLYAFSMIILTTISSVYLLVRFYKNLFTAEGYLMFTLPVTPVQLLNSKLITAYLWSFISSLLSIASIFALGFSSGYYAVAHNSSNTKEEFLSSFVYSLSDGTQSSFSFQDVFGYSAPDFLILCVITLLIGCFFSLTMGYLAIALGQLIGKYKLACSIGFYIALYISTQILSSTIMIIVNLHNITDDSASVFELTSSIYKTVLPITSLTSLVLGLLFYIITIFIMRKKVNLD